MLRFFSRSFHNLTSWLSFYLDGVQMRCVPFHLRHSASFAIILQPRRFVRIFCLEFEKRKCVWFVSEKREISTRKPDSGENVKVWRQRDWKKRRKKQKIIIPKGKNLKEPYIINDKIMLIHGCQWCMRIFVWVWHYSLNCELDEQNT